MAEGPSTEVLLDALRRVISPQQQRDIVSLAMVHDLAVHDGTAHLTIRPAPAVPAANAQLEQAIRSALLQVPGIRNVQLRFEGGESSGRGPARFAIPGVKNIVAIGSGKGGVGKTTVSVNLAIALVELGQAVGLMDADVYGPNVPLMMGIREAPRVVGENRIEPLRNFGVRLMSMGFVSPGDKPIIWRGPMLHSAVQQFLRNVEWGALDYLLIDLPPGTGDVVLSLAQNVPLTGGVVVSTPSDVSLEDGRKALNMFQQLNVDVLGVVENMSFFICPHCQHETDIFSRGGGERTAKKFGVPFLGALPLDPEVRVGGDRGHPIALDGRESARARPFYDVARKLMEQAQARAPRDPAEFIRVRA